MHQCGPNRSNACQRSLRDDRDPDRDPRTSLTISDLTNPHVSVEIRGRAELEPDPTKRLSQQLAHKYVEQDPLSEPVYHG